MSDFLQQMLLKENLRLATENDILNSEVKFLSDMISLMTPLLREHEVPVPTKRIEDISREHQKRLTHIQELHKIVEDFQQKLVGMRTGEESAGMRTGAPVTDEDVNNILKQIDPDIVKRLSLIHI